MPEFGAESGFKRPDPDPAKIKQPGLCWAVLGEINGYLFIYLFIICPRSE
jgi:hypothetical protein